MKQDTQEMAALLTAIRGMKLLRMWRDGDTLRAEGAHVILAARLQLPAAMFYLSFTGCTYCRLQVMANADLFLDDLERIPKVVTATGAARPMNGDSLCWDMESGADRPRLLLHCTAIHLYDSSMDTWTAASLPALG